MFYGFSVLIAWAAATKMLSDKMQGVLKVSGLLERVWKMAQAVAWGHAAYRNYPSFDDFAGPLPSRVDFPNKLLAACTLLLFMVGCGQGSASIAEKPTGSDSSNPGSSSASAAGTKPQTNDCPVYGFEVVKVYPHD